MKFRAPAGPRPKAATQPAPVGLDTAKQALLDELNGLSAKLQRAEADKRHCQEALKEAHVRAAQVAGAAQREEVMSRAGGRCGARVCLLWRSRGGRDREK